MLVASYQIPLPADYDMDRVRQRVAAKAGHWDQRVGLRFKAFCVTERDRDGARFNSYAPFYLWRDPDAARDFLTGAEYAGLVDGFGPVPVRLGVVLSWAVGTGVPPTVAVAVTRRLSVPNDLGTLAGPPAPTGAATPHSFVDCLDPQGWELTRFSLWSGRPDLAIDAGDRMQVYHILHFATPDQG